MRRAPLVLLAALLLGACARHAPAPDGSAQTVPPPRPDGRLPRQVHPTRYALELAVDPAQPRFSGRVRIDITVDETTSAIVLNARGLTARGAALIAGDARVPAATSTRLAAGSKKDPEELVLAFDRAIAPGSAQIEIDYDGAFADGLHGLYRVQEGGRWYAFTQFEPTDARRAFPCFDEPGWKTPFTVAISVPPDMVAVANMPEVRRAPDGARVRFQFAASPPLPTYLVALAVGAFDTRDGLAGKLPIRLIATSGKARLGGGALAAARGQLLELERYFGRPYPYAKLDLLAVPSFGAGAMENAGLITFREERLLLDEHAALAARVGMNGIIAHEISHQWFGDLVTMAWWNDLWLNEAFASFMADEIVDAWRPATGARLQALAAKSAVMADDALATARRIRQPVRSTSDALEAFDPVTYAKGRAVLAMAEAWLGPDAFRAGLRGYLQRHAWGSATADDLYAALGEAGGGRDVAGVIGSFTDQIGVPIVDAKIDCTGQAPAVRLHQQEYRTLERPPEQRRALAHSGLRRHRPAAGGAARAAVHRPDGQRRDDGPGRQRRLPQVRLRERRRDGLLPRARRRRRARRHRRGRHPVARARALRRRQQRLGGGGQRPASGHGVSRSAAAPRERPQPPGVDRDAGGAVRDRSRADHGR